MWKGRFDNANDDAKNDRDCPSSRQQPSATSVSSVFKAFSLLSNQAADRFVVGY